MMPRILSRSSKLTLKSWFLKRVTITLAIMMHPMPALTTQVVQTLVVRRVTKVIFPTKCVGYLLTT